MCDREAQGAPPRLAAWGAVVGVEELILTLEGFSSHSHFPATWGWGGWRAGSQRQVHPPLRMGTCPMSPLLALKHRPTEQPSPPPNPG